MTTGGSQLSPFFVQLSPKTSIDPILEPLGTVGGQIVDSRRSIVPVRPIRGEPPIDPIRANLGLSDPINLNGSNLPI